MNEYEAPAVEATFEADQLDRCVVYAAAGGPGSNLTL